MRPAHEAFYDGRPPGAVTELESLLADADVEDTLVLRLELASALQAAGRLAEASEQFELVDDGLEVLDYTTAPLESVAQFAFGVDDTWRASPPERVMVNTQNLLTLLAAGDLAGAAVEARRLGVLLTRQDVASEELFANSLAWGLAGVVLAAQGDAGQAQEAFAHLGEGHALLPPAAPARDQATVLVVAQLGKAPVRREATYYLTLGGRPHPLSLPVMQRRPGPASGANVRVDDGPPVPVPLIFDLGQHLLRRYEDELPRLLAAAAAQSLGRVIVGDALGEAVEQAAEKTVDDDDKNRELKLAAAGFFSQVIAFLFELGSKEVQGTDTRCWSLLAERFHAARIDLPAGRHRVALGVDGLGPASVREFDLAPGDLVLVQLISATREGYRFQERPRGSDLTHTTAGSEALQLLEGVTWEVHRFSN